MTTTWVIINIWYPPAMNRHLPISLNATVGRHSIRAIQIVTLAGLAMNLKFVKATLHRICRSGDDYFGIPLIDTHDSVLNVAGPARSAAIVLYTGTTDDAVGAVMNVDDD